MPKKKLHETGGLLLLHPKDHWILQWRGVNLYSTNRVLKIVNFEIKIRVLRAHVFNTVPSEDKIWKTNQNHHYIMYLNYKDLVFQEIPSLHSGHCVVDPAAAGPFRHRLRWPLTFPAWPQRRCVATMSWAIILQSSTGNKKHLLTNKNIFLTNTTTFFFTTNRKYNKHPSTSINSIIYHFQVFAAAGMRQESQHRFFEIWMKCGRQFFVCFIGHFFITRNNADHGRPEQSPCWPEKREKHQFPSHVLLSTKIVDATSHVKCFHAGLSPRRKPLYQNYSKK